MAPLFWRRFVGLHWAPPSFDRLPELAGRDPRTASVFAWQHVQYVLENRSDIWQPAKVTWETGRGDCEDFAILVKAILDLGKQWNMPVYLRQCFKVPLRPGDFSHVVACGPLPVRGELDDDRWWLSSNGRYIITKDGEPGIDAIVASEMGWQQRATVGMHLSSGYVIRRMTHPVTSWGTGETRNS